MSQRPHETLGCMRMDIDRLVTCYAVCILPGWEASRGVRLEHTIAAGLGLEVMHADSAPEGAAAG